VTPSVFFTFVECNANLIDPVQDTGVNQYDLRVPCSTPPLCGDYSFVGEYLNSQKVKKTLGVTKEWHTCNFGVNNMFHVDWMHSQAHHIPEMMKNGVRVLIYNGDVDFICNWMGNKAWTRALIWSGHEEFDGAADQDWTYGSSATKGGKVRSAPASSGKGSLTFLQVYEAGHMVPMDQPEAASALFEGFIQNKSFTD
jgi:cathepsin A (carboxypeptidase C)